MIYQTTNSTIDSFWASSFTPTKTTQNTTLRSSWDRQLKWYGHYVNDETQEIWWLCWESNWLTTISDLKADEVDLFEMFEEQTSKHLLPMMAISFEQHAQKHLRKKTSQIVTTFLMNDTSKNPRNYMTLPTTPRHFKRNTSWWSQPIWKMLVKLDHFPKIGVKIKNKWNHRLEHVQKTPKTDISRSLDCPPRRCLKMWSKYQWSPWKKNQKGWFIVRRNKGWPCCFFLWGIRLSWLVACFLSFFFKHIFFCTKLINMVKTDENGWIRFFLQKKITFLRTSCCANREKSHRGTWPSVAPFTALFLSRKILQAVWSIFEGPQKTHPPKKEAKLKT